MTVADFFEQSVGWENKMYNLYVYPTRDAENASGVVFNIMGKLLVEQFGKAHVMDSVGNDLYVCEYNVPWDNISNVFDKTTTRVSIRDSWE